MKRGIIYFLLAAALFVGAYYSMQKKEERDKVEEDDKKVYVFASEDVVSFDLKNAKVTIEAVRKDNDWFLTVPVNDRANNFSINNILDNLKGLEIAKKIELKEKKLADFGLDPALATIVFTTKQNPGQKKVFLIGEKNPKKDNLYVYRQGDDRILLVGTVIDTAKEKSIDDFRDRKLVRFKKEDILTVTIVNVNGEFHLESQRSDVSGDRTGNDKSPEWLVTAPIKTRLAEDFPDKVFTTFINAEAKTFVAETSENLAEFGLDQPVITASFKLKLENQSVGVRISKIVKETEEKYYLKRDDLERVVEIDKTLFDKLNFNQEELIERKLILFDEAKFSEFKLILADRNQLRFTKDAGVWKYTDNPKLLLDKERVETIIRNFRNLERSTFVATENSDHYGFELPSFVMVAIENNKETRGFTIGNEVEINGIPHHYATNTDTGYVYTISKVDYDDLPKDLKDFRSKTVTTIDKYDIREVEYRDDETHTKALLTRGTDEAWILKRGDVAIKNPTKVYELLDAIKQLVILDFIVPTPENIKTFGLDRPKVQLSVKGPDESAETIQFGNREEGNNVFAKRNIEDSYLKVKAIPLDSIATLISEMKEGESKVEQAADQAVDLEQMD